MRDDQKISVPSSWKAPATQRGNGAAARGLAAALLRCLLREMVLRWNLERSHILIAAGYGVYMLRVRSFSAPGVGFRAMQQVSGFLTPGMDGENLWAGLMFVAGFATLLGVITRDAMIRAAAALWLCVLWVSMGACFYLSNPRSPACVVYGVLAWAAFTRILQALEPSTSGGPGEMTMVLAQEPNVQQIGAFFQMLTWFCGFIGTLLGGAVALRTLLRKPVTPHAQSATLHGGHREGICLG